MATEKQFRSKLIGEIKKEYPGAVILNTHPSNIQGFPDLLVLYGPNWVALEVKKSATSRRGPNQIYWVDYLDRLSYANVVYPENIGDTLYGIHQTFRS